MNPKKTFLIFFIVSVCIATNIESAAQSYIDYSQLKKSFLSPDHATWGEVPLWWWEADSLKKERVTWELEKLSEKGVKAVCPIQRSPARCFPESFSDEWWSMVKYVHQECERLGMQLWLYDQVGYGQYGWLEKAAAQVGDTQTSQVKFLSATGNPGEEIKIDLSEGTVLDARAFPVIKDTARDEKSIDIAQYVKNNVLVWNLPANGKWKVAVSLATPYRSFYLNEASTDVFLEQLYQKTENIVGREAMGKSLAGVFQDEHPPTPRDIYTRELADTFRTRFGYDIARAIPALHFDVGKKTPKYRIDFFDAYLTIVEKAYWKKVYDWTDKKNILTSHDNWGRKNIYGHSEGYIDYFRSQRWFSAPGFDDAGQRSIEERNYYDTKIAASIARLYNRPRVWAEAFHSSGWGRSPDQTLSWLSAIYAFGANLYDEHGLYYSLNASTWEHAAPDPHWRQPYWEYYDKISDWVSRTSYIMSQGQAVVDVAVHYPVVSLLADLERNDLDYNQYMQLSMMIYNEGMDNDIIDDQSIIEGTIKDGRIEIRGNKYQALVFGAQKTMRLSVLKKALELVESGGVTVFYGQLPSASVENGRQDPQLSLLLQELLGKKILQNNMYHLTERDFDKGGFAAFLPEIPELLPSLLSVHIDRDFVGRDGKVYISHRKIGELNVYLIQSIEEKPFHLKARLRSDGVPELWDAFSGEIKELDSYERKNGYTYVDILLEGNVAKLIVIDPEKQSLKSKGNAPVRWREKEIAEYWDFSVIPTRNNKWGDFEWPPSNEKRGPEIRQLKYREESGVDGTALGWHLPGFDDYDWENVLADHGPYWLTLEEIPENADIINDIMAHKENIEAGQQLSWDKNQYQWKEITFSQKTGTGTPAPWGGHSGYPDGHFDKNFIQLKEGRKILFTRVYSPEKQRVGLKVQLRNHEPRLWVNNKKEHFSGALGNLPLNKGINYVFLDIPDGERGMLYVQKEPPSLSGLTAGENDKTKPDLKDASWIWEGNTEGAYFRNTIELKEIPEIANVTLTGVSGFRLYINGKKVEEDIGPWASWEYPKNADIKPYLKKGKNLFAVWGQFLKGMNVSYPPEYQGFILAMKAVYEDGSVYGMVTDSSWKGNTEEQANWQYPDFDGSGWDQVTVKGKAGNEPWGAEFLKNAGSSTTPYRPLSVNLASPLLQIFDQMPGIIYDVKPENDNRIGWYRFKVPPGIKEMTIPAGSATIWVNGIKQTGNNGIVKIMNPPVDAADVVIRLKMEQGKYAGAAFEKPVQIKLGGGKIKSGLWENYALPTYSGIGVYKQMISFDKEEAGRDITIDLGEVYVAAEVFINGRSAGVRVAAPYKFNISEYVKKGNNEIEIRVANTLAPHYSLPKRALHPGPVKSGLIGPVSLRISSR